MSPVVEPLPLPVVDDGLAPGVVEGAPVEVPESVAPAPVPCPDGPVAGLVEVWPEPVLEPAPEPDGDWAMAAGAITRPAVSTALRMFEDAFI